MTEKDKDFLEGLAISAACHVLPVRKVFREPIAYSYNGVILPALPEWDRERYPYAVIYQTTSFFTYLLVSASPYYLVDSSAPYFQTDGDETCFYTNGTTEWVETSSIATAFMSGTLWTNTDLLNLDGTIYLAASEPVPVYE